MTKHKEEIKEVNKRDHNNKSPNKPGTAQERSRQILIYTGSENRHGYDPMGERKKEDDVALALRNLSMSKTLIKSKDAERSMKLRFIDANMELEKVNKMQGKLGNPEDEEVESNISSEDCENQEAKYRLLKGENRRQHLLSLWKKAYLKSKGGYLVL